jgi:sporulation protein YlmC with PRC-barrel domain
MRSSLFAAAALGASLAALPAMAQSTHTNNAANGTNTAATTTPTTGAAATTTKTTNSVTNVPPSQSNPLMTENGGVRVNKLIGTDVYNSKDQKLGSVDGVVIDHNGQPQVILSHNDKLTAVPWNKMQFGNAKQNSDNKAMIPDMTQDQLKGMQAYHYPPKKNG